MQTLARLPLLFRAALALVICAVCAHFLKHVDGGYSVAAGPLMLGAVKPLAKSYAWLKDSIRPASADQPEAIPHVLFDTQTYPQAGTASLTFFKSTAANLNDPTLSNFASGQLEALTYFEVHRAFLIPQPIPTLGATASIAGAANDLEILHKTARGIHTFAMAGKNYFGIPIAFFGSPGGPRPFISSFGSGTAANNISQWAWNENNGGFPVLGNIVIPPAQQVTATLTFNGVNAINAAMNITVAYMGILHRPVR